MLLLTVNVKNGQHRMLVNDSCCGGSDGHQVKPCFVYDMRHVIYNVDPDTW